MCEKGFMTAEGFKCVTVFQELIPGPGALYRCTLGVFLHSGLHAEGENLLPQYMSHFFLLWSGRSGENVLHI